VFKAYVPPSADGKKTTVTVDLSPIGGNPKQRMVDNGTLGDLMAGDNIFTYTATTDNQTAPGQKPMTVTATDSGGNTSHSATLFDIVDQIEETVPPSQTFEHSIVNEHGGQKLIIEFSLGDISFARRLELMRSCSVLLDIIKPDNSFYQQDVGVTGDRSSIMIENAEAGTWTYRIKNSCTRPQKVNFTTSGTFMGLLCGLVIDAETGADLSEVYVSTDGGGQTNSADGFYSMAHVEGIFTLRAELDGYVPVAKKITVSASNLDPIDLVLLPTGSPLNNDSNSPPPANRCPARDAAALDDDSLTTLRTFRDTVLKQSVIGRQLIAAYYRHGPEVNNILMQDTRLRNAVRTMFLEILPLVNKTLAGKQSELTLNQQEQTETIIKAISLNSTDSLKTILHEFLAHLIQRRQLLRSCTVKLDIVKPDSSFYQQDIAITNDRSSLTIKNAEAGTWTYRIRNSCTRPQKVNFTTSGTFMGLLCGLVIDAETGADLSEVYVSTDGGGQTHSADGFYSMAHIEGIFTLQADLDGYVPVSKKVNVSAANLDPIDLVLLPSSSPLNSDSDNPPPANRCPARDATKLDNESLTTLRAYRDMVLRKSVIGRKLIALYYQYGPEVNLILMQDVRLLTAVREIFLEIITLIKKTGDKKQPELTSIQHEHIKAVLMSISNNATIMLQTEIFDFLSTKSKLYSNFK
ncbi:MAG: carboxypeptidase-like regulatory domain-containing protein, partial [bacterium]|nr:carboxypeptidase-like regulatory domain-containing protein [bacterium]